jgi:hypothetical protein
MDLRVSDLGRGDLLRLLVFGVRRPALAVSGPTGDPTAVECSDLTAVARTMTAWRNE